MQIIDYTRSRFRGKKLDIPMKSNADTASKQTPSIEHIIVVKRTGHEVTIKMDVIYGGIKKLKMLNYIVSLKHGR
ncbi:MAG: hypothetical protein Ct9H90mP20_3150 [Candidatus Neomarinimicrobiota bacterium]|nr:MAG: hypothetical protein Ct9H90mP20_3150 [Candidatus Neomarinimicrobiota bacterium]